MENRGNGGLQRALTWRYALVTTAALLIVGGAALLTLTRFAPPYTFAMQPDVYLMRSLGETARDYLLADDIDGLNQWLNALQQPVVNVTFDDNWLRLNLDTFPQREQQAVLVFHEVNGVVAVTPSNTPFRAITQIEELPGPLNSDLFRTVPERPGNNLIVTRNGSQTLSLFPIQVDDGRLLALLIVLNFATERPPSVGSVMTLAVGSAIILLFLTALLGGVFGTLVSRPVVRRLGTLIDTTVHWGIGDFSQPVLDSGGDDEIASLASHLNQLRTRIQTAVSLREEIAMLKERDRFAQELHDSVKQQVFSLRMNLATIEALNAAQPSAITPQLHKTISLAQNIQDELTLMIDMFRAEEYSAGASLTHRLQTLAEDWAERSGIAVQFEDEMTISVLPRIAHGVYRVVQEALTNVQKHSSANEVHVTLTYQGERLSVNIRDNGTGFDAIEVKPGVGLVSMQKRVEDLGGIFQITSDAAGTVVQADIPLEES
jgi:signal transduction histidine kinase